MKPTKITIECPKGTFEFLFKSETFLLEIENTGILDISTYGSFKEHMDTGKRQITLTGVLDKNSRKRKLNRKILIV